MITFLYRLVRQNKTEMETILLQAGGYYFLASLTAINVLKPFTEVERNTSSYTYMILGGIVLYFYLMSKLQKSKRVISSLNANLPPENKNMKVEWALIAGTMVLYVFTIIYPIIGTHKVNEWFYVNIVDIYDTAILNFIFGIIGFFFLLQILFQGVTSSVKVLNLLSGNKPADHDNGRQPSDNGGYDDYEIVDDEPEEDDNNEQTLLNP